MFVDDTDPLEIYWELVEVHGNVVTSWLEVLELLVLEWRLSEPFPSICLFRNELNT